MPLLPRSPSCFAIIPNPYPYIWCCLPAHTTVNIFNALRADGKLKINMLQYVLIILRFFHRIHFDDVKQLRPVFVCEGNKFEFAFFRSSSIQSLPEAFRFMNLNTYFNFFHSLARCSPCLCWPQSLSKKWISLGGWNARDDDDDDKVGTHSTGKKQTKACVEIKLWRWWVAVTDWNFHFCDDMWFMLWCL